MKHVVIAAFALAATFAVAIGCHESQPETVPTAPLPPPPQEAQASPVTPDAAPPLIDAPGPMGSPNIGQGFPGTNQP